MEDGITQSILTAKSKVLATMGDDGVNAVPVSAVRITDDSIWLFNFYMDKTIKNILKNPRVSLVCWSGGNGYQIKGQVSYEEFGANFKLAEKWIAENHPERTVKGVLILKPEHTFDISV